MADTHTKILTSACAMQLMRVETTDGRFLGHLFDLRCRRPPEGGAPVIDQIVYGKIGLLERLGLRQTAPRSVHWYLVEAVRENVILVAATKR